MAKTAHARLDDASHKLLEQLRRATGLSESEVIRKGLEALASTLPKHRAGRIVGLGKFASGIEDLGSNEAHLEGFGRS